MTHILQSLQAMGQSSRRVVLAGLAALLVLMGSAGTNSHAQVSGPDRSLAAPIPPEAQSTTGPRPPSGVDVAGSHSPSPDAVVLAGVPTYIWHHGCGPTAAGMVIGYWDGHGFPNLVAGDASTQTPAANEMMASEGSASNYSDYCLPMDSGQPAPLPDLSEPPLGDEHPDECVADYMKTSQSHSGNFYGWSWFSHVEPSLLGYVNSLAQPYSVSAGNLYMSYSPYLTWDSLRVEIDAGRPLVFLVDTDANGGTDHFVPVLGYDEIGGQRYYACYNTWDSDLHWFEFEPMAAGQPWGIYGATWFHITNAGPLRYFYLPAVFKNLSPTSRAAGGDSWPSYDQDVYSLGGSSGTVFIASVDTVSAETAFDIEACVSTTSSSADCFAFGDDQMACTYPPPSFGCPRLQGTLPADGDGIYYLLVESGSAASGYAGPYGLYEATITAYGWISPLTLVYDNRPGYFRGTAPR